MERMVRLNRFCDQRRAQVRWLGALVLGSSLLAGVSSTTVPAASAASLPGLRMTPAVGAYRDGQAINLSVGPNKLFEAYTRVNVIECADPKGKQANLPKDSLSCDGNTIQGNSILVQKNGSFSERHYVLYRLPNTVLGEPNDSRPLCDSSHPCVLYVGEDQNNFHKPKLFSFPFTIASTGGPRSAS